MFLVNRVKVLKLQSLDAAANPLRAQHVADVRAIPRGPERARAWKSEALFMKRSSCSTLSTWYLLRRALSFGQHTAGVASGPVM